MKKIALSILAVGFIGVVSVYAQVDVQQVNPAPPITPNQQTPVSTGSATPGINPGPQAPAGTVSPSSSTTQPGILAEPQAMQPNTYPSNSLQGTTVPSSTLPATSTPSSTPSLSSEPSLNGTGATSPFNSQSGGQTPGVTPAPSSPGTSIPVAKPVIPVAPASPNP